MTNIHKAAREALEALNAMLTHMGMDEDEWNKPTFNQARAALATLSAALSEAPGEEREAFEAWARSQNWPLDRDSFGEYVYMVARDGWTAWHARAMLAARPEAKTVAPTEEQADCGLPPLPSPATRTDFHHDGYGLPAYTADQMHVHAALAAAIERERCARICEQSDDDGEGPDSWGWHSKDYAKAIRKEGGA